MSISLLDVQETNRRLRSVLELVVRQESGPLQVTPDDLTGLARELKVGGQLTKVAQHDPEIEAELAAYRRNLQQLLEALPKLHGRLLAERARLEHERSHIQVAALWAQGQNTLRRG